MKHLNGIPAIRMTALLYAKNGKTLDELVDFLREGYGYLKRGEILRHAHEAGVRRARGGQLYLLDKIEPFWRGGLPVWNHERERQAGTA